MDGTLIMFNQRKSVSRSTAKTTLERSDDDPKGVFFILNKQKTRYKWGGVINPLESHAR